MRFWWVNQNQTYAQEIRGGYLWSPKRKANGHLNPFYETMREVAPGDLVLSFQGTRIRQAGVAQSHCYECPKPDEFGGIGAHWGAVGWRVDVRWFPLTNPVRPAQHMDRLAPLLPERYSPLRADGRGLQTVYLTEIPAPLMHGLAALVGSQLTDLMRMNHVAEAPGLDPARGLWEWEERIRERLEADGRLSATEKRQLVLARRGQGTFKSNVRALEHACRLTRVERIEHLRASHIKPWRDAENDERLDGENGLLLTPSVDHLFDRGFIGFEDDGRLIVPPAADADSMLRMGVPIGERFSAGGFSEGQRRYLAFHREQVLLARRGTSA